MALFLGGFTMSAFAQAPNKVKVTDKKVEQEKTSTQTVTKATDKKVVDYDKMIKEFDGYVQKFVANYNEFLKGDKKADYQTYQKKAESLQTKLDKAKDSMTKEQIEKYSRIRDKFQKALTKKG